MRRLILIATLLMLALPVRAQKYACVNTEYIMKNVPEYNQALNKVNKYVEEWRKEIEAKHRFLQPCFCEDEAQRIANMKACVDAVMQNPGWRLSLQIHRVLNIP